MRELLLSETFPMAHASWPILAVALPPQVEFLHIIGLMFFAGWFFSLGAALGSFLNVLVWRLPHGLSLSRPPSSCPHCGKVISPRDNIPILGWLILRGKCRNCGWGIPSRYFFVELCVALQFLIVAVVDFLLVPLYREGLPPYALHHLWIGHAVTPERAIVWLDHAAALYFINAACLMGRDGVKLPRSFVVTVIVTLCLLCAVQIGMEDHLPSAVQPVENEMTNSIGTALLSLVGRVVVGGLMGVVIASSPWFRPWPVMRQSLILAFSLAGYVSLGGIWYGATWIGMLAVTFYFVCLLKLGAGSRNGPMSNVMYLLPMLLTAEVALEGRLVSVVPILRGLPLLVALVLWIAVWCFAREIEATASAEVVPPFPEQPASSHVKKFP